MNPLFLFVFGVVIGVLAAIVAAVGAIFVVYRPKPTHPHDPELDMLLRQVAESQGWYDEMCRDCGGVRDHVVGCPQLDRTR